MVHTFRVAPVSPGSVRYGPLTLESAAGEVTKAVQSLIDKQYQSALWSVQRRLRRAEKKRAKGSKGAKVEDRKMEMEDLLAKKAAAGEKANVRFEFGSVNFMLCDAPKQVKHGMVATLLEAYNAHLPLELSPDDFWVLIAQGVAQFLGGNPEMAEKYRSKFVDHAGKREMILEVNQWFMNVPGSRVNERAWPIIASKFRELIIKHTSTDLADILITDFSTTGNTERVVLSGTLMETMKHYFEYKVQLACGIPKITLHGTKEDYEGILRRLGQIRALIPDLGWWVDLLVPKMQKILASVEGYPDREFWRRMVFETPDECDGPSDLDGWISAFVPFYFDPQGNRVENRKGQAPLDYLPYATSFTDTWLQHEDGTTWQVKLCTGFLGTHQDRRTLALRPAMGWMTFWDSNAHAGPRLKCQC